MIKIEYVTEVTVKDSRITKSVLSGYTKPQYSSGDEAVFQTLKPFAHSLVRDLVIAENVDTNVLVRVLIRRLVKVDRIEVTGKLISVDDI